ncbi:MAG: hypothetical protein JSC189_000716 [Candidatus Tokpelaia sp. JSC189]|nr:MAG: hypothetical protein JSC189_000716 [Candidatus Tokpelaia sp. JSC189]
MKKRTLAVSAILIASLTLSACEKSAPKISDEEVLTLLGEKVAFSKDDMPLSISKRTEECARMISGLDTNVYKDMSKEMLGSFKTACRKDFQKIISDPQRNTVGLKLEDMENAKFSEQITRVRVESLEKAKTAEIANAKARKEKAAAEKLAKNQEVIAAARQKGKLLETALEPHLAELKEKCAEWKLISGISQFSPYACYKNYEDSLRKQAQNVIDQISKLEAKPESIVDPSLPYFGIADPEAMGEELRNVENEVAAMKEEIEIHKH